MVRSGDERAPGDTGDSQAGLDVRAEESAPAAVRSPETAPEAAPGGSPGGGAERAARRERAMRNQDHVRDNARRDILERRLERFLFWFQAGTALVQLLLAASALIVESILRTSGAVLLVYLALHALATGMQAAQLFYHRRRGVQPAPDALSLPAAMAHVRAAAELLWTCAFFYGLLLVLPLEGLSFPLVAARILIGWTTLAMLAPFLFLLLLLCCLPLVIAVLPFVPGAPARQRTPASVVAALPVATYDPGAVSQGLSDGGRLDIDAESAACPVCIEDYAPGAALRVLPCRHHFHAECVDQWLRVAATCPLCVQPVVPPAAP